MATKRMLIDSSHPEETRVVVATGNRLDEFDFETSTRKQLKGNIYLAKVTRVEPSLQAAFVDYGGNRHGFLPFSEIHPDYYQIPVSDREALFREQEAAEAHEEEEEERRTRGRRRRQRHPSPQSGGSPIEPAEESESIGPAGEQAGDDVGSFEPNIWEPDDAEQGEPHDDDLSKGPDSWQALETGAPPTLSRPPEEDRGLDDDSGDMESDEAGYEPYEIEATGNAPPPPYDDSPDADESYSPSDVEPSGSSSSYADEARAQTEESPAQRFAPSEGQDETPIERREEPEAGAPNGNGAPANAEGASVEEIGGDEVDDQERRRAHVSRSLLSRRYKIQEVIKKRQIMLIQVVKEERGTKGAALTTYLSLAGRYCVLMPNAIRGGGISRKIVNAEDRRRLKAITSELDLPSRMGVIVRTAGMNRTKAEIKRDFEYLLRQWESIRELTLRSTAPSLIYGEADLIRRSIRDLYSKDIDEILVDGDEGYRVAKDFMRTLIPSHTAKVQPYRDRVPLFVRYQVESQLDSMYGPQVQLKSGGYLVINQTEALVAIDVNSGRATRERNIEETAFRTNMEAAEEIARQLRLRDLAGLIVIDFIDMDEGRNQRSVERRLKEAMKSDRARIQIGRISPFGLLELSRQRLRPSLAEASMEACASCGGAGMVRSVESAALHVLRAIEEEGLRGRSAEIRVKLPNKVALYILNNKRSALADIETRYSFVTSFAEDSALISGGHEIERLRAKSEATFASDARAHEPITAEAVEVPPLEDERDIAPEAEAEVETASEEIAVREAETGDDRQDDGGRRRRRRRRRSGSESGERGERGERGKARIRQRDAEQPEPGDEGQRQVAAQSEADEESLSSGDVDEVVAAQNGEPGALGEDDAGRSARRRRRGRRGGRRRRGRGGQGAEFEAQSTAPGLDGEPGDELVAESDQPIASDGDAEAGDGPSRGRRRRRRGRRDRGVGRPTVEHEASANGGDQDEIGGGDIASWQPAEGGPSTGESAADQPAAAFPSHDAIIVENAPAPEPQAAAPIEMQAEPSAEPRGPATGPAADEPPPPEPAPSGPPRRGWWQRVLTGR